MRLALTAMFTLVVLAATASSAAAVGGPVILGGDDQTDHGSVDGSGNSQLGWIYIEKAIANIKPKVGRANDNFIAAFGSADPGTVDTSSGGDAGAAIKNAAAKNGMGVQFFDTPAEISAGFAAIGAGAIRPAVIWIAGDQASNDLDACSGPGSDGEAINPNVINDFVNQGGGLMSHGTCYAWLATLLNGLEAVQESGDGPDLYLTPAGAAAFPGLSVTDIQSDAWHNHFFGNLGGLDILVRSNEVNNQAGEDAIVVIGGGQVSLTQRPTDLSVTKTGAVSGRNLVYTVTVTNNGPNAATGVTVTDNLPAGVTARSVTTSQGSCGGVGTTQVTCGLGDLGVGGTATIKITVRPRSSGSVTNTVSVTGEQPDPNTANNNASDTRTFRVRAARRDRTRPRVSIAGVGDSCTRTGFSARFRIREPRLRTVSVFLDGRRIMRTQRKVFRVQVDASSLRSGRHRLRAVAVDRAGNRRVVRRAFTRCARPAAVPHFTG